MVGLVDDYLLKCYSEYKITQQELERSESIAKLIIISYTITTVVVILLNSLLNYAAVRRLEQLMKFYTDKKLEHEAFIPLPSFLTKTEYNNSVGDDVDSVDSKSTDV